MNPLSATFGAAVAVRNALYQHHVLPVRRLSRPVVSIGNISVGGSGKTPFVIALGQLLMQQGISVDVLSRGYGRRSGEIAVVDPHGSPEQFGDEPLLIAQKLEVPVIVGAGRYNAGLLAERTFSTKLHLLDDGFQHRRLHRDFDIVMLPAADVQDSLLPVGRLREPLASLRRADAVLTEPDSPTLQGASSVWRVRREMVLEPLQQKALAFCGIARPQQFFTGVRGLCGDLIVATRSFRDHHRYSRGDVEDLLRLKKESGAEVFVTTEKDHINLVNLAEHLNPLKIAELRVVMDQPQQALDHLLRTLEQRCGCTF